MSALLHLVCWRNHQQVGIVRDDAEQNGVEHSIQAYPVFARRSVGMRSVGIGYEYFMIFLVISGQDNEMPRGRSADIVGDIQRSIFARRAIEKSRTEAC